MSPVTYPLYYRVYVHCMKGVNRSAAAVAAFLVLYHGLGAEEAWGAVGKLRPIANVGFQNTFHREVAEIAKENERGV